VRGKCPRRSSSGKWKDHWRRPSAARQCRTTCDTLLIARDLNAHWRRGLPSPLLRFKELLQGPVKFFLRRRLVAENIIYDRVGRKSIYGEGILGLSNSTSGPRLTSAR
jgi:hypothetical protein